MDKKNNNYTIILPAYNEERTIEKTVKTALATGAKEVLVINDGSNDKTSNILKKLLKSNPQIRVISHAKNESVGLARRTGILLATYPNIVFFDSDIENINKKMITDLAKPLLTGEADFVMAAFENFGRITEYLVKPLLTQLVPDLARLSQPLAGMFAVNKSFIDPWAIAPKYSMAGILLDIYFHGARIKEVNIGKIVHRHRDEVSKRDHAITACNCILKTLQAKGVLKIYDKKLANRKIKNIDI